MRGLFDPTVGVILHRGKALDVLRCSVADESIDAIVTDPPYGLSKEPDAAEVLRHRLTGDDYEHGGGGFMGKAWDSFVPGPSVWKECLRVLKPGGYMLVFAGSRTVDLMGMSIRLAGFEIRDQIQWLYGSGFPKSMDVSRAIDKAEGAEREVVGVDLERAARLVNQRGVYETSSGWSAGNRSADITAPATPGAEQWEGWGTALKPAHEPIIVARKPFTGTVANNVLTHGTGALNIDATRVDVPGGRPLLEGDYKATDNNAYTGRTNGSLMGGSKAVGSTSLGRWPANVVLDEAAAASLDAAVGTLRSGKPAGGSGPHRATTSVGSTAGTTYKGATDGSLRTEGVETTLYGDEGGPSRFFYCAKTAKSERSAGMPSGMKNGHPTVKPITLMEWLVKMVTPPGGIVLDPFLGSGSTLVAATNLGFAGVGIDRDDDNQYLLWARVRIEHAGAEVTLRE